MKQTIDCSIYPGVVPPVAHYSQFDVIKEGLDIRLLYDGQPYTDAGIAVINGVKPDGTVFQYFAKIDPENPSIVTVDITEQMTSVATIDDNKVICEIRLRDVSGEQDIGTVNFILDIEQSPLSKVILSESDFATLQSVVDSTNAIYTTIATLNDDLSSSINAGIASIEEKTAQAIRAIDGKGTQEGIFTAPTIYVDYEGDAMADVHNNIVEEDDILSGSKTTRLISANGAEYHGHIIVKGDATGLSTNSNRTGNIVITSDAGDTGEVDSEGHPIYSAIGVMTVKFLGTIASATDVAAIVG